MNVRLYLWQRLTAAVLAPLVLVHLAVIFYATQQGPLRRRHSRAHPWQHRLGRVLRSVRRSGFRACADRSAHGADRMDAAECRVRLAWSPSCSGCASLGSACALWLPWCCRDRATARSSRQCALACGARASALGPGTGGIPAVAFPRARVGDRGRRQGSKAFCRWTDQPLVKLAETVLVFLLAIHMLGGLRLLVLENIGWLNGQKRLALLAAAASAVAAFVFLARVF